jgi:adenosylcobinamide kinase/adenosylcobinamide-phosphate guanylyltransferase
LVLGGIRSGKSQWAESAIADAAGPGRPVRYVATGPASDNDDPDWSARIDAHRTRRPAHWRTVETDDVAAELRADPAIATLVDDIGGWLAAPGGNADIDELLSAITGFRTSLVIVSPEVGLTVVPATASGRQFADELGSLNQRLAELCDRVVLVVAGQPLTVKEPR